MVRLRPEPFVFARKRVSQGEPQGLDCGCTVTPKVAQIDGEQRWVHAEIHSDAHSGIHVGSARVALVSLGIARLGPLIPAGGFLPNGFAGGVSVAVDDDAREEGVVCVLLGRPVGPLLKPFGDCLEALPDLLRMQAPTLDLIREPRKRLHDCAVVDVLLSKLPEHPGVRVPGPRQRLRGLVHDGGQSSIGKGFAQGRRLERRLLQLNPDPVLPARRAPRRVLRGRGSAHGLVALWGFPHGRLQHLLRPGDQVGDTGSTELRLLRARCLLGSHAGLGAERVPCQADSLDARELLERHECRRRPHVVVCEVELQQLRKRPRFCPCRELGDDVVLHGQRPQRREPLQG
mmetsp:Transcript_38583/g.91456  ORF Transcript_38583/g.91456 Transcript_38583/m.91456 type:complete len:345 (+) Transcript_38583:453-1487(+)